MELRQLKSFIAVAEELHFGRAAQRLYITQPGLSMQISSLEETLGVALFRREHRAVELTAAGRYLLPEARALLQHAERILRSTKLATDRGPSGVLRLGYTPSVEIALLPGILRAIRDHHPNIEFCLHSLPTPRQIVALQNNVIDMALVRLPLNPVVPVLDVSLIGTEPLVCAIPSGHRLAGRSSLTVAAIRNEPLVLFQRDVAPEAYDRIIQAFRAGGSAPVIAYEVEGLQASLSLVCAGLGIALVPGTAQAVPREGVRFVPIHKPRLTLELGLATRRDFHEDPLLRVASEIIHRTAKEVYSK